MGEDIKVITKKCSKCGEIKPIIEFHKNKAQPNGYAYYCKKCAIETVLKCQRNKPESHRKTVKKWKKNNPEKVNNHRYKRRAFEKGAISESIDFLQICEDCNWVCGICGKKINRKLKYPNPKSLSLDHIIPLSKEGNHIESNIQPAHLSCNSSKKNRIKNIQLTLAKAIR